MMIGATKLLMYNYRDNCYQYYPFGYVKEKTMSAKEQAVILQYLMELTGLSKQELAGTKDGTGDSKKQKGGLTFGCQKSAHHHRFKLTA